MFPFKSASQIERDGEIKLLAFDSGFFYVRIRFEVFFWVERVRDQNNFTQIQNQLFISHMRFPNPFDMFLNNKFILLSYYGLMAIMGWWM